MKKHSIVFLLISLSLLLTSCSGVVENSNFKTDGYILIDGEETVPEYVMKIGPNSISFAEFRYYYLNQKYELDGGDNNVWKDYPEYVDLLKEYVEDILVEVYSIRALASENGIEPDFEKVSNEIKEYKEGMSSDEYKEGLASYYLTDQLYEYVLQGYELYETLFDYYFGENGELAMTDGEMESYLNDNYTHAKHILVYPNTTMSDEDYEGYLNEILAKAHGGEDFDTLIAEYSDDEAMPSNGYYFTDGEMPEEFVLACDALGEGEISQLVKSSHGYHIIQKLPVETSDLGELKDVVYNQIFTEIVDEKISSIEIEYAPEYDYVSPFTVK
ncbi:MAG: peptidylprolyl isomerase [Clostridia bacterium]|nr:peptidylprolyl isomerase [Clostridia bacterium]